jgi:hypothetical protein
MRCMCESRRVSERKGNNVGQVKGEGLCRAMGDNTTDALGFAYTEQFSR